MSIEELKEDPSEPEKAHLLLVMTVACIVYAIRALAVYILWNHAVRDVLAPATHMSASTALLIALLVDVISIKVSFDGKP
jgi:hypothetical protein